MVFLKLFVLYSFFVAIAKGAAIKREKRTVDLFLRGVGDAFGYDVIRRIPSPQLRLIASTSKPTVFPPAVAPLPSGSYSRIMLQLQRQQQQMENTLPQNEVSNPQPLTLPQGAIVLPIASFVPAPIVSQMVNSQEATSPIPQTSTIKPETQPLNLPWQIFALAPATGQQQSNQQVQASSQAQTAPQNQQAMPVAPTPDPQASRGLNISFDSGPTRFDLFGTPMAEAIRRSFNFNINWNRNIEPVTAAALVSPDQISSTATPSQQSAALVNQPQAQQEAIENFEIAPNHANLAQKSNQPSEMKLNADFRKSVKKFWNSNPWNEDFRSEDGKEQDNAQNYFEDVGEKPRTEDIHDDEQSEESSSEEETIEAKTEANQNEVQRKNSRKKYNKTDVIKREKKSSDYKPDDEQEVKGYYKRVLISRKPRDIDGYDPMTSYTKDTYDTYNTDFSFHIPESQDDMSKYDATKDFMIKDDMTKDGMTKDDMTKDDMIKDDTSGDTPAMEKFDVEADIPKKSKVRTKESKTGFNIVKITKKTQVIKE